MANKTYLSIKHFGMRSSVVAVATSLVLSGVPLAAHAAGLGKLVVFSALGQPLRAEIDVTATREELADMKAQLASPETFKQAGLDYATTLLGIRFALDKRPNGQAVIKLSSERPINDPFVDMLLELNWSSGRLVREYTFLLDPPEFAAKAASPVTPAATGGEPAGRPGASQIDSEVRAKALSSVRTPETVKKTDAPAAAATGEHQVKRGETLHRIASGAKPEGVSLDQMLVALFRANPEAFEANNMNRLKAGKILSLPEKSAIESVAPGEARKIVLAQSSDWNAYRRKLAGAAARTEAVDDSGRQDAGGKITAKVDDKEEAAAASRDQLKVSKTEPVGKAGGAAKGSASEENAIAREKALKEANERAALLEKNVADLQKLLELKNQNLAELQKQAAATPKPAAAESAAETKPEGKPASASAAAVPAPAPVAEAPAVAAAPVAEEKPVEAPPQAQPSEAKPAEEPKPAEKPKVAPPPPPPPAEEPGFFEELLGNPMALAGGGGILALLAAYFVARRRRSNATQAEQDLSSTLTPPSTTAGLSANSVFRSTGGQSVDTSSQTPAQTDFSQAGPGSIDTDEVDPVAEADVYMAYGRDAQAEEILLEARQKDPKRLAIHLKLLEIYAGRKDLKQFETLATDLYGETSGAGPDWEKAAAMGRQLDPENPMYRDASQGHAAEAELSRGKAGDEIQEETQVSSEPAPMMPPLAEETAELTTLDFDLSVDESKPQDTSLPSSKGVATPATPHEAAAPSAIAPDFKLPEISAAAVSKADSLKETLVNVDAPDLDFDLGVKSEADDEKTNPQGINIGALPDLDFNLGGPATVDSAKPQPETQDSRADDVQFDVNLTESTFLGRTESGSGTDANPFDMSSIDLDLSAPEPGLPAQPSAPVAESRPSVEETVLVSPYETAQVTTAVNPDFATEQMETLVVPSGFSAGADIAAGSDFASSQAETVVNPTFESSSDLMPELDINASEEVATKLDLAKAYEEMGDLEGARELLQEVLREGDATQREAAQNLLSKIGG